MSKITVKNIADYKLNRKKIVCLTAYSYSIAKILDEYCDIVLVGDSLAMTVYGMNSTQNVDLNTMINHGKAVSQACKKSMVIVDLPYGTYEESKEQALACAKKVILETGCDGIKIETTKQLIPTITYLCNNNINVMAHIGLLPQHSKNSKDFRYQGRDENSALELVDIAIAVEKSQAFSMVIEAVPEKLASAITHMIKIPTIGIGASPECDGQVLVSDDLLNFNPDFNPRFVKKYENIAQIIGDAVSKFADDVRNNNFPFTDNLLK